MVEGVDSEHQVESGLLLNVVIRKSTPVFELFACEDESLLVRGNTLLILNLLFHRINRIGGLHLESDGLTGECLDKNLHGGRGSGGVLGCVVLG